MSTIMSSDNALTAPLLILNYKWVQVPESRRVLSHMSLYMFAFQTNCHISEFIYLVWCVVIIYNDNV